MLSKWILFVQLGKKYVLNYHTLECGLFLYEVFPTIAAVKGFTLVDAAQGIQAQTISNLYWH